MYMHWKIWTVHMTNEIWFLKRECSEATDRFIDCSYWIVVNPIFTLNLRHKFAQWIALSKRTFSKSQNFRLSFWHQYNDGNWSLGFLPLDHAVKHTHTEIGTSPGPPDFYRHFDACV